MSTVLRLPSELTEFTLREPPRSLLIRGEPGTGKTTLGLTLLSSFRGKRICVTSRVSRTDLEQDYPWLRSEAEGDVTLLEASGGGNRIGAQRRALRAADGLIAGGSSEPSVEKLWLPEAMVDAYSRIHPGSPGMVLVDSWDAIVENYLGEPLEDRDGVPDRGEIERLLFRLMSRAQVHLVLIVEGEETSQLDYLVDGVVVCSTKSEGDRRERWTLLKKMRGIRVDNPWYPFSLEGGRFQCIAPISPGIPVELPLAQPEPDPRPGYLWPGHAQFASLFGRLPTGRLTLFEADPDVPIEAVRLLYLPIVSQVLAQSGRLLQILPPATLPEQVWEAFAPRMTPEQFVHSVRLYSSGGPTTSRSDQEAVERVLLRGPAPSGDPFTTRMPEAIRFLREGEETGAPSLSITWLQGLRAAAGGGTAVYTPENLPSLVQQALAIRGMHMIVIGNSTDPLLTGLRELAAIRLGLTDKVGRVFVRGIHPRTPLLVLSASENAGGPYHLLRVV